MQLPDGVGKIPVPTVEFNLVYQLAHIMHHFFDEGIGLRQLMDYFYLGSAELLFRHRQRVADVAPHSDDSDDNPPKFGKGKTKFPQELHHVLDEVAHSRPASCCLRKLGSYVIGPIDSLASTE